jgi:hypothetical protein
VSSLSGKIIEIGVDVYQLRPLRMELNDVQMRVSRGIVCPLRSFVEKSRKKGSRSGYEEDETGTGTWMLY